VQKGRRYFENESRIEQIRQRGILLHDVRVAGLVAAQVYLINQHPGTNERFLISTRLFSPKPQTQSAWSPSRPEYTGFPSVVVTSSCDYAG
jgi:hypothetical protein